MQLLTTNTKLEKIPGSDTRYMVRGLAMAPHTMGGKNVCPWAGFCAAVCVLWFAGRTVMRNVRAAMIARAKLYWEDRPAFLRQLLAELSALQRAADRAGAVAVVRLNTASDIVWERVAPEVFAAFPRMRFFDYTKAPPRVRPNTPDNYTLVHSVSEKTTFADVRAAFDAGRNIVIVFDSTYIPQRKVFGYLPAVVRIVGPTGESFDVETVDGDAYDPRLAELDGTRKVVALRAKGGARRAREAVAAGFVRHWEFGRVSADTLQRDGLAVVSFAS
jgi:hypothetical protein